MSLLFFRIVSYVLLSSDASAAVATASLGHSSVKAVASLYHIGDLYLDIAAPGGVVMASFTTMWSAITRFLDLNALYMLSPFLSIVTDGVEAAGGRRSLLAAALEERGSDNVSAPQNPIPSFSSHSLLS